ncbi:RnfABCDGE type electron transport complex subunit D [Paenibacillus doosanensis]|uniref:RnfABCDGE type electron transport complex subunit D n=1 Tax=Paenibacillus doosanensis TaxID=1229154 RepID=UPI00217FBC32|nr:RnfABCDGE type electron transport complex subunit D [Paenibacillus doosanensis]MCS7461502.1 RnfABCDGE type electron transport complex subunit D [Paenibacillus doosanensis]
MTAKQWLQSPKGYVTMAMIAYLVIASLGSHSAAGIMNGLIAVVVSLLIDYLCSRAEKRKRIVLDGAVITGLIVSLVLSSTASWLILSATAAMAVISKHLIVYKKKPVLNPAALGLLLSIPLFHAGQSWWGAFGDLPVWNILFLLAGGYIISNRVQKYPQVFAFFAVFFLLLLVMGVLHIGEASDALRPPFINATLFFGFFMLTDPPTSPAKVKDQIVFGIAVAVTGAVVYAIFGGLTYLFIGLLAGNIYHWLKARLPLQLSKENRYNHFK